MEKPEIVYIELRSIEHANLFALMTVFIRRNKFLVSPDEFMAGGKTDSSGHFEISGHASEFTSIEPKLNIYHDCDDGIMVSGLICKPQIFVPQNARRKVHFPSFWDF
ncbi:Transthyretin-like family protein [Cooperia oncophora]